MDATQVSDTPANDLKGKPAKARKGKPADKASGKRSLNLSLPVDTYERLLIHAMRMTGGNISDLVVRLANDHLREFHLTRTPTRGGTDTAA